MLLVGLEEDNGWVYSSWRLTYNVGWEQICKVTNAIYDTYNNPEILVDDIRVEIASKDDILSLEEDLILTIRGVSLILKVPIMISFYNQTDIVNVYVASATEEFSNVDYENFNKSLCQYLDSIELAMYR